MSRSVKDLRELINISRLSFHGEDEHYESDERMQMVEKNLLQNGGNSLFYQDEKLSSRLDSSEGIEKAKTDLRNVRFKPLPAINSSKQTKQSVKRKEEIHLAYQRSCNNILEQLDECVVSAWLNRANECIQWLSKCVSTPDFFVRFAKFWLSEMNEQKRTELVEMEVEIIMDEIAFSVRGGLKSQTVCQKDVMSFFLLVIWEYPSKLCGSESGVFILNTFLTLSSSRKERYRGLLSNVKFATKSPEQVHWILSIRAFALISIVTALVRFYTSLGGLPIPNLGPADGSTQSFKTIDSLGFDAVRLGYLNVLMYLVDQQCLEVSEIKGKEESSFLFCAVTHCQDKIVKYILNVGIETYDRSSMTEKILE